MVGAILAALLAFSVALYVAVVGGVLAYHKTLKRSVICGRSAQG